MSIHRQKIVTRLTRTTPIALAILLSSGLGTPAFSQSGPVSVDLSVLSDGGYGPATIPGYAGGATKLLMPGPKAPRSTYVGPPVSVSNPILVTPTIPTVTQSTLEQSQQSTMSSNDVAPPPAPEPEQPEPPEPVVADVLTSQPEPEMTPESDAVALSPSEEEVPPPAAPEPIEPEVVATTESAETDDTVANETEMPSSEETSTTEVAAVSTMAGASAVPGRALQVVFDNAESKLPGNVDSELDVIAQKIKSSENLRIQLMAYAGGDGLSASKARRLSLSRALSVRSFFIENGVRSTRIDVRALGDKTNEEPLNRVDINIVER